MTELNYVKLYEQEKAIQLELLEALQRARTLLSEVSDASNEEPATWYFGYDLLTIDAAIAKATGEDAND